MSSQLKNYITPWGLDRLKQEYLELHGVERPKIVEIVAWAASNGDRSENADYLYGKKRLREIDRRLRFLTQRIEAAELVDPKKLNSGKIIFGTTVHLESEDGQLNKYMIVGEDEFDASRGRISWRSPLASVLLNKKVDDEVVLKKPSGELVLLILKIEFLTIAEFDQMYSVL
jgi:transcription elongation factor GreB